jgi:dUTP pyrophosphatase
LWISPEALAEFHNYKESSWWKTKEGLDYLKNLKEELEQNMELKVKRLTDTAKLPTKAHDTDAGFDLYADIQTPITIPVNGLVTIETGIAVSLPEGHCGIIKDRSSYGVAGNHTLAGVIDESYNGPIKVILYSFRGKVINPGDKFAQMLVVPVPKVKVVEVTELEQTIRGDGGFGSTGV